MIRLAAAHAKSRISPVISTEDVQVGLEVLRFALYNEVQNVEDAPTDEEVEEAYQPRSRRSAAKDSVRRARAQGEPEATTKKSKLVSTDQPEGQEDLVDPDNLEGQDEDAENRNPQTSSSRDDQEAYRSVFKKLSEFRVRTRLEHFPLTQFLEFARQDKSFSISQAEIESYLQRMSSEGHLMLSGGFIAFIN